MTTPPLDLPALRDIAKAATPGEWSIENITSTDPRDRIGPFLVYSETPNADGDLPAVVGSPDDGIPHSDAAHIAAFDPPTVLALLDRVEEESGRADRAAKAVHDQSAIIERLASRAEAAEKAVAAVREALEAHPKACDRHTEDDPIKCGWKRAVADVAQALDSTP